MNEKYIEAFRAVVAFVDDLFSVYGNSKKPTPLHLYRRLISHIKETDGESLNKVLCPFQEFVSIYDKTIMNNRLETIPKGTRIKYSESDTVYIDIQKFIYQSKNDVNTTEAIRQHLITISAILDPDKKKLEELDKSIGDLNIDPSTEEGKFIAETLGDAQQIMEGADMSNPGAAIMTLFTSGVIPNMVNGLQEGASSGKFDMHKLMSSMQTAIGSMMPPPPPDQNKGSISSQITEEIKDDEPDKNNLDK